MIAVRVSDDVSLTSLWAAGEWNTLLPLLTTPARASAARMVKDQDTLEDIVQTALIRCWEQTTVPASPTGFVVTVARNLAVDHLKSYGVRHRADMNVSVIDTQHHTNPEPVVDSLTAMQTFRRAVRKLPLPQRRVLRLVMVNQLTVPEVAQHLRVNTGVVKMRLSRARATVRRYWNVDPELIAGRSLTFGHIGAPPVDARRWLRVPPELRELARMFDRRNRVRVSPKVLAGATNTRAITYRRYWHAP